LHIHVIGKTGTGKSTLLKTMALQDLERGNGFALIDPHGDLVDRIAARVPASHRDRDRKY
jgi:DNA helicase HerA-like ATPase